MKTDYRSALRSGYDDIALNLARTTSSGGAADAGVATPGCSCGCGGMPQFHQASGRETSSSYYDDAVMFADKSPSMAKEQGFINGLDKKGKITSDSYWGSTGRTAYKWGPDDHAGTTGGTVKYYFDPASNWSNAEKATWISSFAMWSGVADISFEETKSLTSANVTLRRGADGGAYTSLGTSRGSGDELGQPTGRGLISIDTSVTGFDLDGGFDSIGGYGLSTVIHEIGHLIGLGHGGAYNGNVDPLTQQYSAYDDRMYTIMSYIYWGRDSKYDNQNPYQGTDWGETEEGYNRQAPHSIMQIDIEAIQQLYGVSKDSPFEGGQTYGFNSNIQGPLADYFDFTVNTDPVVTIYNQGVNNTLDLSGYSMDQRIDLHGGAFSDIAGHVNNVAIAKGTVIDHVIGGSGDDVIVASDVGTTMSGGKGIDALTGGAGADVFVFDDGDSGKKAKLADNITNFSHAQGDKIDLSAIDAIKGGGDDAFTFIGGDAFSKTAGEVRFEVKGGNLALMMDVNGDGKVDVMLHLDNTTTLVVGDLVL